MFDIHFFKTHQKLKKQIIYSQMTSEDIQTIDIYI